jgi:hypothetical protein
VRALELRARASDELRRAVRRWRWSRWSSSRLFTWPLRLVFVAWIIAILAAMLFVEVSTPIKMIALALAIIELIVGWAIASVFDAARTLLPEVRAEVRCGRRPARAPARPVAGRSPPQ